MIMKIGERIKELRIEKGLTQMQLANAIGYAQSIITEWELGRKRPISDAVISLAQFFDVSADYLLGLEDELGNKINIKL